MTFISLFPSLQNKPLKKTTMKKISWAICRHLNGAQASMKARRNVLYNLILTYLFHNMTGLWEQVFPLLHYSCL
jgi:hypothetical protein